MSLFILLVKAGIVIFFLVMFLRNNSLEWGVGLLTVTSAILLDTLLNTFSRDDMLNQLGFFYPIIYGALFAGAAFWAWRVLRSRTAQSSPEAPGRLAGQAPPNTRDIRPVKGKSDTSFDRQLLYEQLHLRFGPDDLLDLIYDMGWVENDVIAFRQETDEHIERILDLAEDRRQTGQLALAIERILTPPPPENLPRRERLSSTSPRPVLRQFLLAVYSLDDVRQLAGSLDVDWESLAGDSKNARVRNLLLYLERRNRMDELVILIQQQGTSA